MDTVIYSYERRKIYDVILRFLHAWNGLAITGLLLTAWISELFEKGPGEKTIWLLHIFLGYALICGFFFRLLWGIFGPRYARFSELWHPGVWWQAIRHFQLTSKKDSERFGHHPLASAAYISVFLITLGMSLTGLLLAAIEHERGPLASWFFDRVWLKHLFKEPHEVGAYLLLGFIVTHIAALIWHEWRNKVPVAQSMVTGYQYRAINRTIEKTGEKAP